MIKNYEEIVIENCIECNLCKKNCDFLKKYNINLKELCYRDDLKYSCFMCGKCKRVCPKDLDARIIIQNKREKAFEENHESKDNFASLKMEKSPYIFKNKSNKKSEILLFLGCSFPKIYPETTKKLINDLEEYNIDFSIECCSKPIYETGDKARSNRDLERLFNSFINKGVKQLVTVCPNCYHFFKKAIEKNKKFQDLIQVKTIFSLIYDLKIYKEFNDEILVFHPCSDKEDFLIFKDILKMIPKAKSSFQEVNCCGLGGLARSREKDIEEAFLSKMKSTSKNIMTYCPSCSLTFNNKNIKNVRHALTILLDYNEEPKKTNILNLLNMKYYKFNR